MRMGLFVVGSDGVASLEQLVVGSARFSRENESP
ncbi:hypothetical protein B0H03_101467 [Rathayibacter iranicus NCPPB 2253 = VKM Ac-1602]|uniref:Uncharacterized protein n=1 Tax=Rathayibacter iranicus NCPPB 2253 = VKM Ac-1602 TaxID=1328868 RepID=A0ABX5LGW2_9MICO|nr:hypothetical protein B0H03_101467 [Rathayibacter iranicus NCPPB 2253 = VKM Ac-1602]